MQKPKTYYRNGKTIHYLLHLPENIKGVNNEKWPMILFLHGAGERGDDLNTIKVHGIPKIIEANREFPFIVVSPQCPLGDYWTSNVSILDSLMDSLVKELPVDKNRLYLTGMSMGGIGGWHLLMRNPDRFSAFVPVCGGFSIPDMRRKRVLEPDSAEELFRKLPKVLRIPIWAFHGENDDIVPPVETRRIIETLQHEGGNAKLTVYKGVGHDAWTETYKKEELYKWLTKQTKS
ncbi:prolyl oligopeptidase family serine peptidase [Alteribacter aurantiacus]|uniref:carboxylesterase family protein n=1 Tax=Alteribacter aurantiacus TaxID=254410 RepID=UPI000422CB2A|nr:prolyl oligopeptidase family serine peptidase [Alteribacter aurantiacus]